MGKMNARKTHKVLCGMNINTNCMYVTCSVYYCREVVIWIRWRRWMKCSFGYLVCCCLNQLPISVLSHPFCHNPCVFASSFCSGSRLFWLSHCLPAYFHIWRAFGPLPGVRRVATRTVCLLRMLYLSVAKHSISYAWYYGYLVTYRICFEIFLGYQKHFHNR